MFRVDLRDNLIDIKRVLLLVVLAEVGEVSLEYSMELPASDTWLFHRSPHNVAHSPDVFSELSLLRGRR